MIIWFVRHIPTGNYIPEPKGRSRRGGSHLEPSQDKNEARIFRSERSAKIFLSTWLKGKTYAYRNSTYDDWDEDFETKSVSSRKREEMEIISYMINLEWK